MIVYAESSAVLSWLLGEERGEAVRDLLHGAEVVVTSDLTLIECDRAFLRAIALKQVTEAGAADHRADLNAAAVGWQVLQIGPEIVERARRPFPGDPIRALDAVHLASALVARQALPGLELVALDQRIRSTGRTLGLRVLPA